MVLRELWLSHPQLCLSVSHYEIVSDVKSEKQCRWKCEQQKKCVMVRYDPNSGKCWLSADRKMTSKAGCNKLFDYYIKGNYYMKITPVFYFEVHMNNCGPTEYISSCLCQAQGYRVYLIMFMSSSKNQHALESAMHIFIFILSFGLRIHHVF